MDQKIHFNQTNTAERLKWFRTQRSRGRCLGSTSLIGGFMGQNLIFLKSYSSAGEVLEFYELS